jgi:hypothetical protein
MRLVLGFRFLIVIVAVIVGSGSASVASAARDQYATVVPVGQLRALAAGTYPGVVLPTKLPPRVAFADLSFSCATLGVGGPPCIASLHYITSPTNGKGAFQLAVYQGRVSGKVVQALRRHDGKFGTTSSFAAGRFAGTRERQWDKSSGIGGVDTYVWQYKANTYALLVHFLQSGAQSFPGMVPRTVIASFS